MRVSPMSDVESQAIAEVFQGSSDCIRLFESVRERVGSVGSVTVRVTRTQVAFAADRQFAWAWRPRRWTRNRPEGSIALSFALHEQVDDPRIVEATQTAAYRWTHHVILQETSDLDDAVLAWIRQAYAAAGGAS
jgi:hypothetical protein